MAPMSYHEGLLKVYNGKASGNLGIKKTMEKLQWGVYWVGLSQDVIVVQDLSGVQSKEGAYTKDMCTCAAVPGQGKYGCGHSSALKGGTSISVWQWIASQSG